MSEEYDEDMLELMKKTDELLKKYGVKSTKKGFISVAIDTPGKIIRFRKKPKEELEKNEKHRSVWLIDESIKGIKE